MPKKNDRCLYQFSSVLYFRYAASFCLAYPLAFHLYFVNKKKMSLKSVFSRRYRKGAGDSYKATEAVINGFRFHRDLKNITLNNREYFIHVDRKIALLGLLCVTACKDPLFTSKRF